MRSPFQLSSPPASPANGHSAMVEQPASPGWILGSVLLSCQSYPLTAVPKAPAELGFSAHPKSLCHLLSQHGLINFLFHTRPRVGTGDTVLYEPCMVEVSKELTYGGQARKISQSLNTCFPRTLRVLKELKQSHMSERSRVRGLLLTERSEKPFQSPKRQGRTAIWLAG